MLSVWVPPRKCTKAASVTVTWTQSAIVDPLQVYKGFIRVPAASHHVHSEQTCACIVSNVDEVRIVMIVSPRHIYHSRSWKISAPCPETAPDLQLRVHPREIPDSLAKFLADKPKCAMRLNVSSSKTIPTRRSNKIRTRTECVPSPPANGTTRFVSAVVE